VKEHEWLLDGSPASDGEVHLRGLAGGCVGLGQDHCCGLERLRARAHQKSDLGRPSREHCCHQHDLTDLADDLKDLTVTFDISEGLVCILALTGPI
jgi:hypothetical protein